MVVTKGRYDVTSPGRDVGRFGRWVAEYRRITAASPWRSWIWPRWRCPCSTSRNTPRRARTRRNARGTSRDHRSGVRLHPGAARVQLRVYRAGEERPRLRCSRCAACVPQVGLVSPLSCLVRADPGHRPETNEARRDHEAITGRHHRARAHRHSDPHLAVLVCRRYSGGVRDLRGPENRQDDRQATACA
jgi:hypothetical protein